METLNGGNGTGFLDNLTSDFLVPSSSMACLLAPFSLRQSWTGVMVTRNGPSVHGSTDGSDGQSFHRILPAVALLEVYCTIVPWLCAVGISILNVFGQRLTSTMDKFVPCPAFRKRAAWTHFSCTPRIFIGISQFSSLVMLTSSMKSYDCINVEMCFKTCACTYWRQLLDSLNRASLVTDNFHTNNFQTKNRWVKIPKPLR